MILSQCINVGIYKGVLVSHTHTMPLLKHLSIEKKKERMLLGFSDKERLYESDSPDSTEVICHYLFPLMLLKAVLR